jgi:uroporphyrinogen decarboxylase
MHMVTGGDAMFADIDRIREALSGGPHIFNLGHGITPDANIDNVHALLKRIRG